MRAYFEEERGITLVGEVEAADINAWFASMRKTPGSRGKVRSDRAGGIRAVAARLLPAE
jgi:integrase/recombinase XerD